MNLISLALGFPFKPGPATAEVAGGPAFRLWKPRRIPGAAVAALLLAAPFTAYSVTDTWDGGGANDNFSLGANWADNTAPASDFSNTDLVFAGAAGLFPNVDAATFGVRSITFDNTAGAFTLGGNPIVLGFIGIVNNDTHTQTINNALSSPFTSATFDAASGGLTFGGTVSLPTTTLFVDGANATSFRNFSGPATVHKRDAGVMSYAPTTTQNLDLLISAGTVQTVADGSTDVFSGIGSIAVDAGTFTVGESLTLNGAALTRASGAAFSIAGGKTFTVQGGGDVTMAAGYTHSTTGAITVTGDGSTFTTGSTLSLSGDALINVLAGADLSAGAAAVMIGATAGGATVNVNGSGSTLAGGVLDVGLGGTASDLSFSDGSTGTFTAVEVDDSTVPDTIGALNIGGGAMVSGNSLELAPNAFGNTGMILVTGTGSALTVNGAGTAIIGAASASSGTLDVESSGIFTTGTGAVTIHATGAVNATSGTVSLLGDTTVNGLLTRGSTGTLTLAAGKTLTAQGGGEVAITGPFNNNTASTITVTGADSSLSSTGSLFMNADSTLNVLAGGSVSITGTGNLNLGNAGGSGTLLVEGVGSSVSANQLRPGLSGLTGTATFRDGATGTFSSIQVDVSGVPGSNGTLNIRDDSVVSAGSLRLADNAVANSGLIEVINLGAELELTGAATATIGAASGSSGILSVRGGGIFRSGTGLTTVNATGLVDIANGRFEANGDLTLNGGTLEQFGTLLFDLAAGTTFTIQAGGEANFAGSLSQTQTDGTTIIVTGAGSRFSIGNNLDLSKGQTTQVLAGATLSVANRLSLASGTGTGTVLVDGTGSSLSAAAVEIGDTGGNGNLTFSGGSSGTFADIDIATQNNIPSSGSLIIQSGAEVTGTGLEVGAFVTGTGSVAIDGSGSTLALTGAATTAIGIGGVSGSGTLTVSNGGLFDGGTGAAVLNGNGTLSVTGTGSVARFDGPFTHSGVVSVGTGGLARFLGNTFAGTNGLAGAGTVEFGSVCDYQPGVGPVEVGFGGSVILRGAYTVQIAGPTPGTGHDRLNVAGAVTLDSLLVKMEFTGGFAPSAAQTFDIIDGATLTGDAVGIVASGLLPGWEFAVDAHPGSGILRVTSLNDAISTDNVFLWTGFGFNPNLDHHPNWTGIIAPPSDLANTVIVFGPNSGQNSPNVGIPFSTKALWVLQNTPPFTFSGQPLSIGTPGIYDEGHGGELTFNCSVDFSGVATSRVACIDRTIHFSGPVTLPGGTLRLEGNNLIRLRDIVGTGAIEMMNPYTLLSPTAGVQQYDITVHRTLETAQDGSTDVFGGSASITLADGATFNVRENLTLDGAAFASGGSAAVSIGEFGSAPLVRLQGGSDMDLSADFLNIEPDVGFIVSGAGSTLRLTDESHTLGTVNAVEGGSISSPLGQMEIISPSTLVDGVGSNLTAGKLRVEDTTAAVESVATFRNGATSALAELVNLEATLIQSGAVVTTQDYSAGSSSEILVSGGGSTLAVTGTAPVTLRGTARVEAGGALIIANAEVILGTLTDFSIGGGATVMFSQGLAVDGPSLITSDEGGTNHLHGEVTDAEAITVEDQGTELVLHDDFSARRIDLRSGTVLRCLGEILDPLQTTFGNQSLATSGTIEFHGGLSLAGDMIETDIGPAFNVLFAASNTLSLGLGVGLHDTLTFNGAGATAVTWGGKLRIVLEDGFVPGIGEVFPIFRFDPASDAGSFSSFDLPVLPEGSGWDLSSLYTTGEIRVVAISGIEQWRVDEFGTAAHNPEAADLFDADFDGLENLLEYALGLDPHVPDVVGLPTGSIVNAAGEDFPAITFTRPLGATDIGYQIEVTTSLSGYEAGSYYGPGGDVPTNAFTTQVSRTDDGVTETITVRDNTPFDGAFRRFLRLKVTNP